jgi:lipopolysaccharide/colanic/teichoic acid biosynthesis glycosyltransferase
MWNKLQSATAVKSNGNGHGVLVIDEAAASEAADLTILAQPEFLRMLCLERKRTERSRRPFVLMLLKSASLLRNGKHGDILPNVLRALARSTRETDITGWHREGAVLGVIFTEIGAAADGRAVAGALLTKVTNALSGALAIEQINEISLSFHVFPEDWEDGGPGGEADPTLYPDLARERDPKKAARLIKRAMDVTGSLCALIFLAPLLVLIAAAIKLTSKGPVLFCQERLGHHGRRFKFLKFRSMQVTGDTQIHQEYIKRFIAGTVEDKPEKKGPSSVYKIKGDPRVTPLGRILRKTSLDELPQFLNVLKGEMSLVGPRPPIPYELDCYDIWHKKRLLEATPGITGLWQVEGRSRVKFDDMVRMDLRYARSWSLGLDIKILLQTPKAVLLGSGAC